MFSDAYQSPQGTMTSVNPPSSEQLQALRIVLIGGRELGGTEASGKTTSGNTILGKKDNPVRQRTSISIKSEGERFGRHVTVVDTPGWWWHYSLENTPKYDQIEFKHGAALCSPGPHAFLLVIPVNMAFPDVCRFSLEEHLGLLKGNIWKHTIVLFSSNGPYQEDLLRAHFRRWPDLQRVIKNCQNRFHIFDNKDRSNGFQVLELFTKIEEMVVLNNGQCYKSEVNTLSLEQWRRRTKEAAKERIMAVETHRAQHQALLNKDILRDQLDSLKERRIVILGAQYAARSSSGNTILGKDVFDEGHKRTAQCAIEHGLVEERHVRVVDTPGWFYISSSLATSIMDKMELKHSVSLCAPGPQAVILTVPFATAFNKSYCQAVREHMMLFGDDIWTYTIVLFTRGDWLGDTTAEERIESEGDDLKWLIEKCGNRYHVFNNKNRGDNTQVKELLDKIDEMVANNGGSCYEMDRDFVIENDEKMRSAKENAKTLRTKTRKIRATLKEFYRDVNHSFSEHTFLLLGGKEAGKSSAGNTILMESVFRSCLTKTFQKRHETTKCLMHEKQIFKKKVTVVDTPGWGTVFDDASVLVEEEIARGVSMCSAGIHAFLLVVPANRAFTEEDRKATSKYMSIIGESVWKYTILIFTFGDWISDKSIEEYIESEGGNLKWLVEKCGYRYHVLSCYDHPVSQVSKLLEKTDEMMVRNRRKPFYSVGKQPSAFKWLPWKKTLTEDEWIKREDDLIKRMLKAVVAVPDTKPLEARDGSFDFIFPNMSGETPSEFGMSVSRGPAKVAWWRDRYCNYPASSGHGTMEPADAMSELEYDTE